MTRIELIADGMSYDGVLNDTLAARDFLKRLPYQATCRKCRSEYYSSSANGIFDPLDLVLGFQAGDIIQWDGWFSVAFQDADEESKEQRCMIIGKITDSKPFQAESDSIKIIMKKQEDES